MKTIFFFKIFVIICSFFERNWNKKLIIIFIDYSYYKIKSLHAQCYGFKCNSLFLVSKYKKNKSFQV